MTTTATTMMNTPLQPRMANPAMLVPEALQVLLALSKSTANSSVPTRTLELVHLRTSQINGCSACVDMGSRAMRKAGETDQRLFTVAAWRETPFFSDAERAALALAEATTRLADRPESISDEIWNEAARHYDEPALANLVIHIAMTNVWNRLNAATRQVAGSGPY